MPGPSSHSGAETPPRRAGRWPLLPIAPLIVAVIGIAAAMIIVSMGAGQLQRTSDAAAALRSKALAATLAARLRSTPSEQWLALLARLGNRSGARLLVVDDTGAVIVERAGLRLDRDEARRLLDQAEGLTSTPAGRMSFAVSTLSPPLERLSVLTMVDASEPAAGTTRMTHAVALLTLLMLGVAVVVALVFMRANRDDVSYVRQRIADMARHEGGSSAGAAVPVRSLDQVGVLTAALNQLVGRFAEAEKGYRADLEAAAQIDTERSQFLAGLSHELRTPLNAILGFTHLLESEADGPLSGEAKEALGQIRTSGEHLKALVDDILDLSAAETGQLKLSRAAIDVLALAEEVVREARATVIDRPVRLEASGEARVHAWADPRRLRQVLTNLVANAVKATAQGTIAVTVGRDRERRMAIVSVSDSGHGIVPEVLQAIFEPYKQAGDVRTQQGGVGLGLAIARRLVLLHGGSITAESEPGRGSVFRFELPDETHVGKLPRDSLVPWADGPRGTEPARGVLPSLGADAGARPEGEES